MTPYLTDADAEHLINLLVAEETRREELGASPSVEGTRVLGRLLRLVERNRIRERT